MRTEKHIETVKEVLDEIKAASIDRRGLAAHQRRLALMISLGTATLIELYFHKLGIMKPGSALKHEWLKQKNVKDVLAEQIIKPISYVKSIDEILEISSSIENKRNDLAYGSPVNEERILLEEIQSFFKIKELIESILGEQLG